VRSNVRMSGVMMILVGALMAWQLFQVASIADHVWSDAEANQYADKPGGGVNLDVIGTVPANVTVLSLNGTILFSGPTNATGHLQTPPKTLAVNVRVAVGNQTWTRKVISYEQLETPLKINTASDPPTQSAWVQPDLSYLHWFWIGVVAFGLTALGGVAAAMLRGATFAFAMSILFLAGAAFLLLQAQTFTFILFAAMAAFSVWAIRKGRDRFTALEIAGLKL
jgi:hypothetical protein